MYQKRKTYGIASTSTGTTRANKDLCFLTRASINLGAVLQDEGAHRECWKGKMGLVQYHAGQCEESAKEVETYIQGVEG